MEEGTTNDAFSKDEGLGDNEVFENAEEKIGKPGENEPLLTKDGESENIGEQEEERIYIGDKFRVILQSEDSLYSCEKCFNQSKRFVKLVFAIVLFCVIFGSILVSKGSILYISSQMNKYIRFLKTGYINTDSCGIPICLEGENCSEKESIRWVWAMYICQCSPYTLMFLRSVWKVCFKTKKSPTLDVLIVVMITESLQAIGMFMFLYCLLPYLDAYRSLFIMTAIATVPSFLLIFNQPEESKYGGLKTCITFIAFLAQLTALVTWFTLIHVNPIYGTEANQTIEHICDVPPQTTTISTPRFTRRTTTLPLPTSTIFSAANKSGLIQSYMMNNDTGILNGNSFFTTSTQATTLNDTFTTMYEYTTEQESKYLIKQVPEDSSNYWALIIAPLLISIGFWENFVDDHTKLGAFGRILTEFRKRFNKCKTKTYLITSIWKVVFTFILLLIYSTVTLQGGLGELFDHKNFYMGKCYPNLANDDFQGDWLQISAIQVSVGIIAFYAADVAIKGRLQVVCYTVPLVLSTPVTFCLLFWACQSCNDAWNINTYSYWNCFSGRDNIGDLMLERYVYVGIIWWLSQLWISRYLWFPNVEKLAKMDKIFTYPMYCGATFEQSLCYIRRRNDFEFQLRELQEQDQNGVSMETDDADAQPLAEGYNPLFEFKEDGIPFIYICATMWHETEDEMLMMMKSLLRLDEDQMARRNAQEFFKVRDPDYYLFEANIFFDDAFTPYEHDTVAKKGYQVNEYVDLFMQSVRRAVKEYHRGLKATEPVKYITPYGGRLEWVLPSGKNRLIVHLKDKMKIRNRKRWSQVMYIHYFLGQGILAQPVTSERKDFVADNTYVLALDGDIDFQPNAVILLLDLMKRNIKVGAACGRIHPTGNGPMVWYQKFEYSLSHWLQKATEHVLGCVLCSPGCFSLFRGSALMDDNVAATYSKRARKPLEYIQYDQGEDRWLCTLLLQQGYRVEYSAAADAYTHAPVGFNEFYGQRRRWITSTFANLLDLLKNARFTAKKNENISMLYMFYQGFLFASSILGPATIFMLVVGAFEAAFMIQPVVSFVCGLIPLVGFMILCFVAKNSTQLAVAALLSAIYAVLQMFVIVGIARQMVEDGVCSPSAVFFLFIAGTFILAAILHPQEFTTLFHGFLYFLLIPCMYLLLIIYSLCNVHVVSWGTRENKPTKTEEQLSEEKKQEEAMKQAKGAGGWRKLLSSTVWGPNDEVNSSHTFSCGSLCKAMCCVAPGASPQDKKLNRLQRQMTVIQGQLLAIHESVTSGDYEVYTPAGKKRTLIISNSGNEGATTPEDSADNYSDATLPSSSESETVDEDPANKDEIIEKQKTKKRVKKMKKKKPQKVIEEPVKKVEELEEPVEPPKPWVDDECLGEGEKVEVLSEVETNFWNDLISKYLYPLDESNVDKERISEGLKTLRNRSVFAFFIIDMLLMVLILGLNLTIAQNPDLAVKWNCTVNGEVKTSELDPIGFSFVIVFGIILAIQVGGMLIHRMFTFLQIISTTLICKGKNFTKGSIGETQEAIELAKEMQRIEPEDDPDETNSSGSSGYGTDQSKNDDQKAVIEEQEGLPPEKRNVVSKITNNKTVTRHTTMGKRMAERFLALQEESKTVSNTSYPAKSVRGVKGKSMRNAPTLGKSKSAKTISKFDNFMSNYIQNNDTKTNEELHKTIRSKYGITQKDVNRQKNKVRSLIPTEFRTEDDEQFRRRSKTMNEGDCDSISDTSSQTNLTSSASRQTLTTTLNEECISKTPYRFESPSSSQPNTLRGVKVDKKNTASKKKGTVVKRGNSSLTEELDFRMFERPYNNGDITYGQKITIYNGDEEQI